MALSFEDNLDLAERNPRIKPVVRFREKVELRFNFFFCRGFGDVATAQWLEERKSENEDGLRGTCRVVCPAGVGMG